MIEERYASRIRQVLNQGLSDMPATATRRLEAARHHALAQQKQVMTQTVMAGTNSILTRTATQTPYLKQLLAIAALLLGMWISFYWHSTQYVTEIEEVDSALLTDDLPPDAFLDNDFFEWLKDDSSEE